MKLRVCLIITGCFCLLSLIGQNVSGFQSRKADAKKLRRQFAAAVGRDFEIVKDEMVIRPRDSASDFWLVRVKPQRSGYYTLKYTYKFVNSPNDHPEEGENTMRIGVGGEKCYRRNVPESGIANFCLGDTLIIPIRMTNLIDHKFTFERREQQPESLEKAQKEFNSDVKFTPVEPLENPLAENLRLLGIQRADRPHRDCCPITYEFYAVFEALKPGKFNLGLSSLRNDEAPGNSSAVKTGGTPIIIVNPGTPITGLISSEDTIHYSDDKRFSSHAGNSFLTNLLILQPGDVFALRYTETTIDYGFGAKSRTNQMPDLKPAIDKITFAIERNWNHNDWLPDYSPKRK